MTCDGTTVLGVKDIKIVDKTTLEDITADSDTAVSRFPTIKDADFSATIIYDPADTGQIKIWASKAASPQTLLAYIITKGTATYTLNAYVESVDSGGDPKTVAIRNVTFSVSGGVAVT